jgi:hypothetical protein
MSSPFVQSVTSSAPFRVRGSLSLVLTLTQIWTSSTSNGWQTPHQVILCLRFTISFLYFLSCLIIAMV